MRAVIVDREAPHGRTLSELASGTAESVTAPRDRTPEERMITAPPVLKSVPTTTFRPQRSGGLTTPRAEVVDASRLGNCAWSEGNGGLA